MVSCRSLYCAHVNKPTRNFQPTLLAMLLLLLAPGPTFAVPGQLLTSVPFAGTGPQGIAHDTSDNTFWVTSFVDTTIQHYDADGVLLGSITSPFPLGGASGITYYSTCDTLLVVNATSFHLIEIDKTGAPVSGGIDLFLPLQPVVNPVPTRFLRGLDFWPEGDSGLGSIFVVETIGALIYEFNLDGIELRTFEHPDDPDGFPGSGAGADAGGIEVLTDAGTGALTGFDLVGSDNGAPVIRRLDRNGNDTGLSIPLVSVGAGSGDIGGIARAPYFDAMGAAWDAIYGVSETGVLFIIDGAVPPIANLLDLACSSSGNTITLSWTNPQSYDSILIERNGEAHQLLAGATTNTIDTNLADGVYHYEVFALDGTLVTERLECTGVVGAGQVQAAVDLSTITAPDWFFGITEDASEQIWITGSDRNLYQFTKDLTLVQSIAIPFPIPDDFATGVAYRASTSSFLIANGFDNTVHEIDVTGTSLSTPIALQLPSVPDDPPQLAGMTFDASGNGGMGSLWLVDIGRALIYECALDGSVLGVFPHPDEVAVPTPDGSSVDSYTFGISGVPGIGTGHDQLDLPGGTIADRRTTKIVRVDAATGAPSGLVVPADDISNYSTFRFMGYQNSTHNGSTVAFVLGIRFGRTHLFRIDRTPPQIIPPSYLTCRQTGLVDEVELTFNNHGPYDAIEIARDGVLVATLPGTATQYLDSSPPTGIRRYSVTAVVAMQSAEPSRCEVRVGKGAVLQRKLAWPIISPYQMTRNPLDGTFFVTTNAPSTADLIFRYDTNLDYMGQIPSTAVPPQSVAALAIRPTATDFEIISILWDVSGGAMGAQQFFWTVQDSSGATTLGPLPITIPGPPPTEAITYPAAMTHDPITDTLWFLERNSDTFINVDVLGNIVQSFAHPDPPAQEFVFNIGLSLDADRGAFSATTSNFADMQITRTVSFTHGGETVEDDIPLDAAAIDPLNGFAREDSTAWVCGSVGSTSYLIELKAADPVPPATGLSCTESAPNQVTLDWTEPAGITEIEIERGGAVIATVPAGTLTFTDSGVGNGPRAYAIRAVDGALQSAPAACSLIVSGLGAAFVRGDASDDGNIDIGDAVFILSFLFNMGMEPPCLDAADVGDDGTVNIGDPVYLLAFLFSSGPQPPLPYPDPGGDPTPDTLVCP